MQGIELQLQNWAVDMSMWTAAGVIVAVALLVLLQVSMAYRFLQVLLIVALLVGVVMLIANPAILI